MCLWWKISIPRKNKLVDLLKWVEEIKKDKKSKIIIKVSIFAVIKQIWNARNEIIFKKVNPNKNRSWIQILESTFFWLCNRSRLISMDWNNWISNPFVKV